MLKFRGFHRRRRPRRLAYDGKARYAQEHLAQEHLADLIAVARLASSLAAPAGQQIDIAIIFQFGRPWKDRSMMIIKRLRRTRLQ